MSNKFKYFWRQRFSLQSTCKVIEQKKKKNETVSNNSEIKFFNGYLNGSEKH